MDYYTKYIKKHGEWEFVKVYTDEGISATNTKHLDGFNQMIKDAPDGKIDLIITKSMSRFARNTVDSLSTIRKLKEHNVECYFEREQIWTFDGKRELLITIMSSLAQEESRSISKNVTWGHRKRMADGKVSLSYSSFLDYMERTVCLKLYRKKPKLYDLSIKITWRDRQLIPSQKPDRAKNSNSNRQRKMAPIHNKKHSDQ